MKQLSLCVDVRMVGNSGIGTYIRALIVRLKDHFSLKLIVNKKNIEEFPFLKDFDLIYAKSKLYSILEQFELPFLIPKCDVFWSPHFNIPLLPIRAKKRIVTIHDVYFLAHKKELSFLKQIYANLFFSQAIKRSDRIITISNFSKSEIVKYLNADEQKISVISLGVEKKNLTNKPKRMFDFKYLLFVGNLAPHKNIIKLIQSLDFLPRDLHLVLSGRITPWQDWKIEADQRSDRVHVLGKVTELDLESLYVYAEMLVHPSLYEGFGLTPLEAMSYGCSVVVSNLASLPEVCGDAVEYVNPFSPEAIAKGVLSILQNNDRREALVQRGGLRIKCFDWEKSLEKYKVEIFSLVG